MKCLHARLEFPFAHSICLDNDKLVCSIESKDMTIAEFLNYFECEYVPAGREQAEFRGNMISYINQLIERYGK
jgi:hypothetical protein